MKSPFHVKVDHTYYITYVRICTYYKCRNWKPLKYWISNRRSAKLQKYGKNELHNMRKFSRRYIGELSPKDCSSVQQHETWICLFCTVLDVKRRIFFFGNENVFDSLFITLTILESHSKSRKRDKIQQIKLLIRKTLSTS